MQPEQKEKLPRFHSGFEAFLPPDAANYDDWNELFASPKRLKRGLGRLFEVEHGQRFACFQEPETRRLGGVWSLGRGV